MSRRKGDEKERKVGEGEVCRDLSSGDLNYLMQASVLNDGERNKKRSSRKTGFDGQRH
jgi:hypothetical protein